MTRTQLRVVAAGVSCLSALFAYVMQPDNLTNFSNPKLAAFILGGAMVVLTFLNNWLPSLFGPTPGEPGT